MSFDQVRMLAAVILFLASVVTAMWGTEIAGATAGAWTRGRAQAGAEKRRLENAAREARERNSGGRGASGAWQRTAATRQGMKGAAKGAGAWSRKEDGPLRRIFAATTFGALLGAKGAQRAEAGAKRQKAAARAAIAAGSAGPGRGKRARGSSGPGRARGAGARGWRPRKVAVCDVCGVTAGKASVKPVTGPGGREHRACLSCRTKQPLTASTQESRPGGQQHAGWRPPLGPASPAPASAGPSVTEGVLAPEPVAAPAVTAATSTPAEPTAATAAASTVSPSPVTSGNQQAITGGTPAMTTGRYAAIGGGSAGTAVATRAAGAVSMQEGTTHGAQDQVAQEVITATGRVRTLVAASTDALSAENASESQIGDMAGWADEWGKVFRSVGDGQAADNSRLDPYVDTVQAAGGPSEVADPGYHGDY